MPIAIATERSLAKALTKLVDLLHHKYPGIKIKPIPNYEDEDFTVEISIPKDLPVDQVEETCHLECIKIENEYNLFIYPKVIYNN